MNGSIRKVFLASTLSLFVMTGCDDKNRTTTTTPTTPRTTTTDTPTDPRLPDTYAVPRNTDVALPTKRTDGPSARADAAAVKGDAEVLAMLSAIDKKEVHATAEAMKKTLSEPVLEFSEMLHVDHSACLEKTNRIALESGVTVGAPAQADQLVKDGQLKVAELVKLNDREFERAYMAEMIRGHMNALSLIDNQLLAGTQNAAVKEHLTEARAKIAHHLKRAQEIQDNLDKGGADNKTPENKTQEKLPEEDK